MKYSILVSKSKQSVEPVSSTASATTISSNNWFYIDILSVTQSVASEIKTDIKQKLNLRSVKSEELCLGGTTASIPDSTLVSDLKLDYYVVI